MSALHHEVLAVMKIRSEQGGEACSAKWLAAVVWANRDTSPPPLPEWRAVARCLADLRRRGLAFSTPRAERRGHLWSVP